MYLCAILFVSFHTPFAWICTLNWMKACDRLLFAHPCLFLLQRSHFTDTHNRRHTHGQPNICKIEIKKKRRTKFTAHYPILLGSAYLPISYVAAGHQQNSKKKPGISKRLVVICEHKILSKKYEIMKAEPTCRRSLQPDTNENYRKKI